MGGGGRRMLEVLARSLQPQGLFVRFGPPRVPPSNFFFMPNICEVWASPMPTSFPDVDEFERKWCAQREELASSRFELVFFGCCVVVVFRFQSILLETRVFSGLGNKSPKFCSGKRLSPQEKSPCELVKAPRRRADRQEGWLCEALRCRSEDKWPSFHLRNYTTNTNLLGTWERWAAATSNLFARRVRARRRRYFQPI